MVIHTFPNLNALLCLSLHVGWANFSQSWRKPYFRNVSSVFCGGGRASPPLPSSIRTAQAQTANSFGRTGAHEEEEEEEEGGRKSSLPLLCSSGRLSTEGGGGEETLQKEVVESDTKGRDLSISNTTTTVQLAEWAPFLGYDLARSFMVRGRVGGSLVSPVFPSHPTKQEVVGNVIFPWHWRKVLLGGKVRCFMGSRGNGFRGRKEEYLQ